MWRSFIVFLRLDRMIIHWDSPSLTRWILDPSRLWLCVRKPWKSIVQIMTMSFQRPNDSSTSSSLASFPRVRINKASGHVVTKGEAQQSGLDPEVGNVSFQRSKTRRRPRRNSTVYPTMPRLINRMTEVRGSPLVKPTDTNQLMMILMTPLSMMKGAGLILLLFKL